MTIRKVYRTMSNTRILIVDGSNVVMRCALGGELSSAQAVPTASNMIERATRECEATHLVIALDCPGEPTWRKAPLSRLQGQPHARHLDLDHRRRH